MMKKTEAIEIFGSEAKLAQALNLSRSAVSQWGDTVPPLRAYQIKEIVAHPNVGADQTATIDKVAA